MVWPITMLSIDGKIKDFKRIKFYSDHLVECIKLLEKDIPLKGYFAWSFR